jgi:heat shock protein HtpX
MTIVIVLVGMISIIADWFFRVSIFGGRRNNEDGGRGILAIIGVVLIVLSPIISQLIKLAISRRREYLADASGVLLTRYPEGLANALEKIKNDNQPLETATTATAHLYISNPFKNRFLAGIFSTHPPIEDRIAKLRQMTS